jgi:hypothetical protein
MRSRYINVEKLQDGLIGPSKSVAEEKNRYSRMLAKLYTFSLGLWNRQPSPLLGHVRFNSISPAKFICVEIEQRSACATTTDEQVGTT